MSLHFDKVKTALPFILAALPSEWRGTTFKNSHLLGRKKFSENLSQLIQNFDGTNITTETLVNLGNAEDYLRVSTNISCLLEFVLAIEKGYDITHVFTFSSSTMPVLSVLLTTSTPVHLFVGENGNKIFNDNQIELLQRIGLNLHVFTSNPVRNGDEVILSTSDVVQDSNSIVDGVIYPNILFINNDTKIVPSKILVIRKRMCTPMTTPEVEASLHRIADMSRTTSMPDNSSVENFYAHLQVLSGTDVNPSCYPICFTAGLPAICSLWTTIISEGGADIVMASTAYGGSSELTDILAKHSPIFRKHTFDITGKNNISLSIFNVLERLSEDVSSLMNMTVLFVEIPTNPDMKVPEMTELATMLTNYKNKTGKEVLLLVDTTFAPGSQVLSKMYAVAPDLTTMVFISLSKSVSRGLTTGGTLVAGCTEKSCALLHKVSFVADILDSRARPDQLQFLADNHNGVEDRCQRAYEVAVAVGNALCNSVKTHCDYDMPLAFVTPEQASLGFSSSTFSFNLPALQDAPAEVNEGLAQRFVDLLCEHKEFKPCVSFGQDNGLVYATVPATSTQGAIKPEDKAKQAVGGVQLTRLSFPPTCDIAAICNIINDSVATCYSK
jgi:cysteine synthase A